MIAPPGVPLHFPEHEAVAVSSAKEYEATRRARTRCCECATGWRRPARSTRTPRTRWPTAEAGETSAAVEFALASPYPRPMRRCGTSTRRRQVVMSRRLPYIAAINEAISQEMVRDQSVLYFGQNIATTENDEFLKAFGGDRVRVTPISETAEIGMAVGAALAGYRPVVELYMAEFMLVAMDQVVNEAPRFRYMSGGRVKVPLVLKAGYGFTAGWAGQHTGSIYGMFTGVPGLKVALPATPADAKGLMATAIRDDNPVCFFHHYLLTLEEGEVPEGEYLVPFGRADVRRTGGDVTVVATGAMVGRALAAADALAASGVEAEVIDPRTLAPLDVDTILDSVRKTGRLVLVDQATRHASAAVVIAAEVADQGFGYLKAPVKLVTALDATVPYSKPMEDYLLPRRAEDHGGGAGGDPVRRAGEAESYPWPYRRIATEAVGADNIMFAIDYPYQTTEAAVRFLDEAEISDENRRKIYHRNAERIFGIPDCEEPT